MSLRKCRDCGIEAQNIKDLEVFAKHKQSKHGRKNLCSVCQQKRAIRWASQSKERSRERNKKHNHTFKGLLTRFYSHQKGSSTKRGHKPPDYTKEELSGWVRAQPNFKKLFKEWEDSNYETYKRPSVDRLDDSKGYSFDNIRLVTWKENERSFHDLSKKVVLQIDKDGTIVAKHNSLNEAGKAIGTTAEMVGRVCRGQYGRKSHKGFIWKYE